MTAPARARFRAPWIALPLALVTLFGATPAFADEVPDAAPPAAVVETAPAPAVEPEAPEPTAQPVVEPGVEPGIEEPTVEDAAAALIAETPPAAAAAATAAPVVTITPSTIDPTVANTLTVSGTGFVGDGAVNGTYIVIGKTADWATGRTPAGVTFPLQAWVTSGEITDGAFSKTVTIPAGTLALGTEYSVGTFAAHALAYSNRTLDTWNALTLSRIANPVITVTPSTIDPTVVNTLTVSGIGFVGAGAANGTYVVVGTTSDWVTGRSPAGVTFPVQAWVTPAQIADGAFSTTITIPAGTLALGTGYSVGTFAAHALAYSNRTLDTWNALTLSQVAAPRLTVTPATIDPTVATTLTVSGAGFIGDGAVNGTYVVIGTTSDWATGRSPAGAVFPVQVWVRSTQITAGAFTTTVTIPAGTLTAGTSYSIGTFAAHALAFTDRTLDSWTPLTVATPTGPVTPPTPTTPPAPTGTPAPRLSVSPGALDPAAATTLTITGTGFRGAGAVNGVYVSVGTTGQWRPGQVPSQGGWVVTGWVTPSALSSSGSFTTTLRIPAGVLASGGSYGVASFAAHGLSLTDRSLDAWAPIALTQPGSGSGNASDARAAASTPPADEGIELESDQHTEGGEVSATAAGFQANESGILVVIYSDPVVLDSNATADADGVVHWNGRLPGGLIGDHTLTFQGSIDVGIPIRIAENAAATGCTIDDARLDWGFKESFRAYVSGAIAHGEWTTDGDAGYETPSFFFTGGSGSYDADAATVLQFGGSVRFTGHDGALDTTIANPRIEVGDDAAVLLLDVSGTTQDGRELVRVGVPFADLDLSQIEPAAADGSVVLADIPATLTTQGAEVFGTYAGGEALDPVTLTVPAGNCTQGASAVEAASAATASPAPVWPIWTAVAVLLALVALIAFLVVRRRGSRA